MADVTPNAKGQLESTPLGHLLVHALDRVWTGSLVFEEPSGAKHAVYLEEGSPAKARLAQPALFLSELLVAQKAISEEQRQSTLASALEQHQLHGQVLLAAHAIDERALREGLREQVMRQVLWLFDLPPKTLFGYYDGINFLERWGGASVRAKPLALIWRGLREHAHPGHRAEVLAKLGQQAITLHVDAPVRRFRFEPREHAVIDVLRAKPQPLAELLGRELADETLVQTLVYTLILTRQLDGGVPGVEPIGVDEAPSSSRMAIPSRPAPRQAQASRSSPAPTSRAPSPPLIDLDPSPEPPPAAPEPAAIVDSPEVAAFKAEIRQRAEVGEQTHYAVLGIPADAPATAVQSAFFQLAKRWHPDRLGPDLADVKELATRAFARMSEAHQVLSDPTRRREYDDTLRLGSVSAEEQEQVQRVVQAVTAFQKAEVFLKRNNPAGAEEEARKAAELDPTQADYGALVAWLESSKPNANLENILARLDKAAHSEPNNLKIRWYRGQVLNKLGKGGRALADFRFIVEKDPRNVDAQREIRLFEMRRSTPSPAKSPSKAPGKPGSSDKPKPPDGGSLFGKWFKR